MKIRLILKGLGIFFLFLVILYFMGPRPAKPRLNTDLPKITPSLTELEKDIQVSEKNFPGIKEDNEARIVWADPAKKEKTKYSLVYLHGFTASQGEGAPTHEEFAQRYGCNLYLARLDQHGTDNADGFAKITPESLLKSAKKAIAVAQQIGDEVIIMATSTGSTLGLYVASEHPEIKALILYSPLIDFFDPALYLLDKPWGLQIAKMAFGGDYVERKNVSKDGKKYWTNKYHLEGVLSLKSLVVHTMTQDVFAKIKQPIFLGYYYKDEENQDNTVSVKAMKEMFEQLGTPDSQKRQVAFPKARDHVIASFATSKDRDNVRKETFSFAEEILQLKPVQ